MANIDDIIKQYEEDGDRYRSFEETLYRFLQKIIEDLSKAEDPIEMGENDIEIRTRTKESRSLRGKIERKDYKDPLSEITDLVGAKIMLTSLRYAELVYELVKKKFSNSVIEEIDKSKLLKDQRKFGYLGKHIVIRCSKDMEIEEFRKFDGMSAEIQIKTLLQHTWAEIEHKLRYKPQAKLDDDKQRYFDRLAAMIEVADDLFKELILEWEKISNKKIQRIPQEINQIEENAEIEINNEISLLDSESILLYLDNEKVKQKFSRLQEQIGDFLIFDETPEFVSAEFVSLLDLAGFDKIKKINTLLDTAETPKILKKYLIASNNSNQRFNFINTLQILVYSQLDREKREIAKRKGFVSRLIGKIVDGLEE